MKRTYEAWIRNGDVTFTHAETILDHRQRGLLEPDAKLLYQIEADTWEEASAIHHLRMGWKPYQPGKPAKCPNDCGAYFYPDGSGECPNCGKIC